MFLGERVQIVGSVVHEGIAGVFRCYFAPWSENNVGCVVYLEQDLQDWYYYHEREHIEYCRQQCEEQ